jgi:uncharacterized protein (DUF2141 family)
VWFVLLFSSIGISTVASGQTLPPPWNAVDVGNPALAGAVSESGGVFTIAAAGSDIWATSDQFHFVYQAVTGDVDIRARVDDLTFAHSWAKAGVMIRGALTASAAHGFALASAGKGIAFQRRPQSGGSSRHTAGEQAPPPRWLRLVRQGARVTAYSSVDGASWVVIAADTIALGSTAYVGIAVTSHNANLRTTAHVSNVGLIRLGLPDGVGNADIGAPAVAGSAGYLNGTYTIRAAGTDIWGSADQFHYVYRQMSGDGEVVARVASVGATHSWAKAGVMIRETLSADSAHAYALVSARNGYAFQRRAGAALQSTNTSGGTGAPPGWLRLVRAGSTFTAYRSPDGVTWTAMGSDAINMAATVYVGIAVTSHNPTAATTAIVDSFSVAETLPAPNKPPLVSLTAPANGSQYTAPATIAITASASDPEGRLAAVDFYNGQTLLGRRTTSPFTLSWADVPPGTYALTAVALDADGQNATSAAVSVSVTAAPNQLPTVSLTAPANGSQFVEPALVILSAIAADPEGRLSAVRFYAGQTLLGTATTAPYSVTWSSVPAGTYTLTAVAQDADGGSATSTSASITVLAAPTAPRYAVFTASVDHNTLVTSYVLEVFASGADPQTATPIAMSDLGKPTPAANGDITVDRATFFAALPAGSYVATVAAVGPGGSARSAPITFTR